MSSRDCFDEPPRSNGAMFGLAAATGFFLGMGLAAPILLVAWRHSEWQVQGWKNQIALLKGELRSVSAKRYRGND